MPLNGQLRPAEVPEAAVAESAAAPSGVACRGGALPLPTNLQPHQGVQGQASSHRPPLREEGGQQPHEQLPQAMQGQGSSRHPPLKEAGEPPRQQQQQPARKVLIQEPARQQQPTLDDARAAVAAAAAAAGPDVTHACLDAAALAATEHVQGRARTAVAALLPPAVPPAAVAAVAALVERSALARCATNLLLQVRAGRGRGLPMEGGECMRDAASGLVWEVMQQGRPRRERGGGRSQPLASGAGGAGRAIKESGAGGVGRVIKESGAGGAGRGGKGAAANLLQQVRRGRGCEQRMEVLGPAPGSTGPALCFFRFLSTKPVLWHLPPPPVPSAYPDTLLLPHSLCAGAFPCVP